jgi:hypothetical protein
LPCKGTGKEDVNSKVKVQNSKLWNPDKSGYYFRKITVLFTGSASGLEVIIGICFLVTFCSLKATKTLDSGDGRE